MGEFLASRFSFFARPADTLTWCTLAIVWVLVLACAISSVFKEYQSPKQRMFWTLMIVGLPVAGLLCYLPFSFKREDYPMLFAIKK